MNSRVDAHAPAESSDQELVARHLAGDPAAFAALYERHYGPLLRFVRKRVYESDIVDDLTQETFAQAIVAISRLRNPARFYPWLTAIARHLISRHNHQEGQRCYVARLETHGHVDAPDVELLRRADQQVVQDALDRVRRRHRQILVLREELELSYEDIAAVLGTPVTTVPPLLYRARKALRREYLAMTQSGPPVVVTLIAAARERLRRLRFRIAQYGSWAPDAQTVCGTVACIALGIGGLAAALPPWLDQPLGNRAPWHATGDGLTAWEGAAGQRGDSRPAKEATLSSRGSANARPSAVVPGIAEAGINNPERADWARERSRDMPIYQDLGPAWFGADPAQMRRDLESTLAGNPEWMEGACGDDCPW